jgi:hypothetical protein
LPVKVFPPCLGKAPKFRKIFTQVLLQEFSFFFCDTRIWAQGFTLARKQLYPLCHASRPFLWWLFGIRSHFLPRPNRTTSLLFYASYIILTFDTCILFQPSVFRSKEWPSVCLFICLLMVILEMGSLQLFAQAGLKPQTSSSQPPKSGITGVSHRHLVNFLLFSNWLFSCSRCIWVILFPYWFEKPLFVTC